MAEFPAPPANADVDTYWTFIEEVLDHIMIKLRPNFSLPMYTKLYNVCYSYAYHATPRGHYTTSESARRYRRYYTMNPLLYNNFVEYFVQHLQYYRDYSDSLQNERLLRYYATNWDRYTTGVGLINRSFNLMNRNWVMPQREDHKRTDVYPIYTLGLVKWRTNFFLHIQGKQSKLAGAILRLIEHQRNGETIDQGLVKKVVDSFVSLSIDENDLNKASLDIYKEHFEIPFLIATEAYYKHESESFVAENSVSDYLKKAEERLKEEEDRVERYLHTTTRKLLLAKCEHVLIREHSQLMWENFQNLLDYDKNEDLHRMYSLLSRIPEGLEPLRRKFEEHVKRTGLAAVSRLVQTNPAAVEALKPRTYVDALLEVHTKSSETVNRNFQGEAGFVASLDRACREFVNRNAATTTSSRTPELLAKHADALLRKSNKVSEGDLEGALNRVMVIFKYLEEKDVFRTFYSTNLSKRLMHGVSASGEAEASMISKLKEACGLEYTTELQHMLLT